MSVSPALNLARIWEKDNSQIKASFALLGDLEGVITCTGSFSVEGWNNTLRVKSDSCDLRIGLDGVSVELSTSPDGDAELITVTKSDVWQCVFSPSAG